MGYSPIALGMENTLMIAVRGGLPAALIISLTLAGCSSMRSGATAYQPEQIQPVQQSTVAQTALPPIGQDATQPNPMNPGPLVPNPALTGQPGADPEPAALPPAGTTTTASSEGSFVTLDAVGTVPSTPGRDLSGGLTVEKLLGGWTVTSGPVQCRLNLTQTAKEGTQRYRASTPGCQVPQLAAVSSWQLAGSQVQLFNERGDMIAALIVSGNRFIGTLAGGQGISMVG